LDTATEKSNSNEIVVMKFLQTYRTSCKIGQSGSDGFQFYSFSKGLTEQELNEISLLGSYKPPMASNLDTTDEEAPVAFKYFRLSSGRVGVLQSAERAEEYTGRSGNYFTHALILEQGRFPFLPILMQNSQYFRKNLTEEENNIETIPPLLPALEVDLQSLKDSLFTQKNLATGDGIGKGKDEELLSKLLDLVLSGKVKQKKGIILADNHPEEIILALSYALPFEKVLDLTFSTYSHNPDKQPVLLSSCKSEGCAIDFNNTLINLDYYVFNRDTGKFAGIENQSEFSKTLAHVFINEPEKINELYSFSNHFTGEKDSDSMDMIAFIFRRPDFTAHWERILPFVADKAKPDYAKTFLSEYKDQIDNLTDELETEDDICLYFKNLLLLNSKVPDNKLKPKYNSIIVKRLDIPTKSLIELNKRILDIYKGNDLEGFKKFFIDDGTNLCFEQNANNEFECMNAFTLIVSTRKILFQAIKNSDIFTRDTIINIINRIDEKKISSDSFQVLISEISDEIDVLLLGISIVKAHNLAKRIIHELFDKKGADYFYDMMLKGVFENALMTEEIREEAINQLEKSALMQIPTAKELKVYERFEKWVNSVQYPAISLILAEKNIYYLIGQMVALHDTKKLSVFLEWRRNDIFPFLKRPEDWNCFYSLINQIALDYLNMNVEKYYKQAKEIESLVALIIYSHDKKSRQMDELLRKIFANMKRSDYNVLKLDMEKYPDKKVSDYFISLIKNIQIKRFFNLKF